MANSSVTQVIDDLMAGRIDSEQAKLILSDGYSFEEGKYARIDTGRKIRCGFPEVVFCQGKADEHLLDVYKRIHAADGRVLGTRANPHQAELVASALQGTVYDPVSRVLKVEPVDKKVISADLKDTDNYVVVCTAGTADIAVAEEAALCAEFFGTKVYRMYDVGVCGIHRLLSQANILQRAVCTVAVAGMEGALPSVIGGLVKNPVIAVPTSIGYGASFKGVSALLTMINSCANGIAVVNIDNGFGAGYMASQIYRLKEK